MNKSNKLFKSIILLFKSLDLKRRYQFIGILIVNIFNGIFEFISLGSALLFLESLTNPKQISPSFDFLISTLNINNESDLILTSTLIFLLINIINTTIRILNLWLNTKFRISFLNFISNSLYKKIINQEYYFFINRKSSDLLTDLTSNIENANFFFENFQTLITSIIISFSIIFSLFRLNFQITIGSVILFSTFYTVLGMFINKKVEIYSKSEFESNYNLTQLIQDSLNAIKEIIISNNHNFYSEKFSINNRNLREYRGRISYITSFPRYLFEGIGLLFIGIAGFIIYSRFNNAGNIIALLGAFAIGAQKLLPSMQSAYKSWSLLYSYNKPLNRILYLLKLNVSGETPLKGKLSFKNKIKFENLSFSYKTNKEKISKNINLEIKKGENIGIFGRTGSGKTTLINIFMGILTPAEGNIYIDNLKLFNKDKPHLLKKWKNNLALVPQDVFLYDASILENIAFCVPRNKINIKKVEKAAKIACAHDFIIKTKSGYKTLVGDKGVKLSGGQKQRLGIARAIYNDSEILILDESTSSLDFKTEKSVMESIFKSNKKSNLTTITIAHRLSTLKYCDKIIELGNGEIKEVYKNEDFLNKFRSFF